MNKENLRQEENQLREQIAALSETKKRQYYALELQHIKDPDTYAALNWAFLAGLHHFYLGKWLRGVLNLILMLVGALLYFTDVFSIIGLAVVLFVLIIELPQLFNSQNIIHQYNNQLMRQLLQQLNK